MRMNLRRLLALLGGMGSLFLSGQNLIPNPSFEDAAITDCIDTLYNHVYLAAPWYAAAHQPDFYTLECGPDWQQLHREEPLAQDGENFVGLWCSTYGNGLANGDAIGVELAEPLEDRLYYFRTWVNSRGTFNPSNPGEYCPTRPSRALSVYLGEERVEVVVENGGITGQIFDNYIDGRLAWADSSYEITTTDPSRKWFAVGGCLQGVKGDRFLAMTMNYGWHGYEGGCARANGGYDFQTYYYDFDNLSLEPLPSELSFEADICENRGTVINVANRIEDARFGEFEIRWPNGILADEQNVTQVGQLDLALVLPCGEIPIKLNVSAISCESQAFAPNIFSPNGDDINDLFLPTLNSLGTIEQYQLLIFDRWGRKVFESDSPNQAWDGRVGGKYAQEGVYAWQLVASFGGELRFRTVRQRGSLTLVR